MTERPDVPGHVALLAGMNSSGAPVHEVVPGRRGTDGTWELLGTPALATGCAAGDVIRVEEAGDFEVVRRGGNIAVVAYAQEGTDLCVQAGLLMSDLEGLGHVEVPADGRWLVATVPVTVGFAKLEQVLATWKQQSGIEWFFGNVYDEDDAPLNWW